MRRKLVAGLVIALAVGTVAEAAPATAKKMRRKPVTFQAAGSVALPNPTDLMGAGITRTEFETSCAVPAASQGLDGYVIRLPKKVTAVTTNVAVVGTSPSGIGLLDLFFFDGSCAELGEILGSDTGPPVMPSGTKFVLVTNWLGDPTDFVFHAVEPR